MSNKIKIKKDLQKLEENILAKSNRFSRKQVKCLLQKFVEINGKKELKMDRLTFQHEVLHLGLDFTDEFIIDRIFRTFDKDNDSKISAEEWIMGLSVILRGTKEEKMKFCFDVYDMNSDGWISKDEMFHLLKLSLTNKQQEEDPDENVRDLVDSTMKKLDEDQDMRVSFDDYRSSVEKDELIMEFLGACLPADDKKINFENSIFGDAEAEKY